MVLQCLCKVKGASSLIAVFTRQASLIIEWLRFQKHNWRSLYLASLSCKRLGILRGFVSEILRGILRGTGTRGAWEV